MSRLLRSAALAFALAATPSCAGLSSAPSTRMSVEQSAVALMDLYALTLAQATKLIADPATPAAAKTALAAAERRATPAVELVKVAALAHRRVRSGQTGTALSRALAEAYAPAQTLAALVGR